MTAPTAGEKRRWAGRTARLLDCSVGVMAYNEEGNIANALRSMLSQEMSGARVTEVIVVASGCKDRTADIVAESRPEPRIRLIEQRRREGKASAINSFIEARPPRCCSW